MQVQSPASEWEVTVIELLHSRLISNNLQQAVYSFIQVERAFRFKGTSVIIMEHHPYGSLLVSPTSGTLRVPSVGDCTARVVTVSL